MKYINHFKLLNLVIEYYRLSSTSMLSDMELERLEYILILSDSNCILDYLITEIDINLAENKDSEIGLEEYYNQTREKIKQCIINQDDFVSLPE